MKRTRKVSIGAVSETEGERDPSRFYCPYPGCNRSFAELWRLKVHYRAPPDIRGSGKERGHGTELSHCPKCGKELQPGKHHVGCGQNRTQIPKPPKRIKVEHEENQVNNGQQHTSSPDQLIGVPTLWGQTLLVNQQQLQALQEQYTKQQLQMPVLPVQQGVSNLSSGGNQQVLLTPNMIPVMLGQQPGVIVLNSGLQAANYSPYSANIGNNSSLQLPTQVQFPQIQISSQSINPGASLQLPWLSSSQQQQLSSQVLLAQQQQQQFVNTHDLQLFNSQQLDMQQQQQPMYSEADSSYKDQPDFPVTQAEEQQLDEQVGLQQQIQQQQQQQCELDDQNKEGEQKKEDNKVDTGDDIFGDLRVPPLQMCPSPPPLPPGCSDKDFRGGQLFDFDRCLQDFSKSSANIGSGNQPNFMEDGVYCSSHNMDDILQLLFQDENDLPFMTTHLHRRLDFEEEVDQEPPILSFPNFAEKHLEVEESIVGDPIRKGNREPNFFRQHSAVVHSSCSSRE